MLQVFNIQLVPKFQMKELRIDVFEGHDLQKCHPQNTYSRLLQKEYHIDIALNAKIAYML